MSFSKIYYSKEFFQLFFFRSYSLKTIFKHTLNPFSVRGSSLVTVILFLALSCHLLGGSLTFSFTKPLRGGSSTLSFTKPLRQQIWGDFKIVKSSNFATSIFYPMKTRHSNTHSKAQIVLSCDSKQSNKLQHTGSPQWKTLFLI